MTESALSITNVDVNLGAFNLQKINLNVEKGTIMGFVGKNGAGKTTLIKAIMDVIQPANGEILFDGLPLYGNEETVKAKIGVVYDTLIYPATMRADKIVKMIAPFYTGFDMERWHSLMKRFELKEGMKLADYSKGMQMKFSIAMALSHNPEILILDEPTAGVDPAARADILDLLLEFMQDEKKTIFFSTHITSDLDKIADYITLIDGGKIVFSTQKDTLLEQYAVVHIEKEALTEKMKQSLSGLKETAFGFEGLSCDLELFKNVTGVKIAHPSVEDIIIYRGGQNDHN